MPNVYGIAAQLGETVEVASRRNKYRKMDKQVKTDWRNEEERGCWKYCIHPSALILA